MVALLVQGVGMCVHVWREWGGGGLASEKRAESRKRQNQGLGREWEGVEGVAEPPG